MWVRRSGSVGGEVRECEWGGQSVWVRRSGSVGEEVRECG